MFSPKRRPLHLGTAVGLRGDDGDESKLKDVKENTCGKGLPAKLETSPWTDPCEKDYKHLPAGPA